MIRGALSGALAVAILLLVPVLGVRHELSSLVGNWQELALYVSAGLAGVVAGARLTVLETRERFIPDSGPIVTAVVVAPDHSDIPDSLVESSLVKKKWRLSLTKPTSSHTRVIACYLYLVLYVNCAVLCQHLGLGIIVTDEFTAMMIRNFGICLVLVGLYMMLRGLLSDKPDKSEQDQPSLTAPDSGDSESETDNSASSSQLADGNMTESGASNDAEQPKERTAEEPAGGPDCKESSTSVAKVSHVPPSKLSFLSEHRVCSGWLIALTGLPLVFLAWFPVVAIPGIFVVMGWMFTKDKGKNY